MYAGGFRDAADDGYGDGQDIGWRVGSDEAYYRGQQNAFDSNFQAQSIGTYNGAYASAYGRSFKDTFSYYGTHPVLSVKIRTIKDATNPAIGIIQPGAEVTIQFDVTNEGGAAAAFTASSQGDLTPENSDQAFNIPRLKSATFTAPKIAVIKSPCSTLVGWPVEGPPRCTLMTTSGISPITARPIASCLSE